MKYNSNFKNAKNILSPALSSYAAISVPIALLVVLFTFGSIFNASGSDAANGPAGDISQMSQMVDVYHHEVDSYDAASESAATNRPERSINPQSASGLQASEFQIVVNRNNFHQFFTLTGRVNVGTGTWTPTFAQDTGIITLTEQTQERAGFASLNRRISPEQDFFFQGAVNLGANSKSGSGTTASGPAQGGSQGGDGMGFFFHSYEPGAVGMPGSGMGIGGLSNAFGFKLDTFSNRTIHNTNLSRTDRMFPDNTSFAGFIHTAEFTNGAVTNYFVHNHPQFDGTGTTQAAQTNSAQASLNSWIAALPPERANEAPRTIFHPNNNNFRDIEVHYGGANSVMTIDYNDRGFHLATTNPLHHNNWRVWEKDISPWMVEDYLSFGFSAATGGAVNLQQVRFDEFRFTPMSNLTVRYIDEATGNPIIPARNYSRPAGTQIQLDTRVAEMAALGFDFVRAASTEPAHFNASTNTVTLSVEENRTVTLYFRLGERPITVNFETEDGNTVYFRDASGAIVSPQTLNITATHHSTFRPPASVLTIPGHELVAWYVGNNQASPTLVSADSDPRIVSVQGASSLTLVFRERLRELTIRKVVESNSGDHGGTFDFNIAVFDIHNNARTGVQVPFVRSSNNTGTIDLGTTGSAQGAFSLQHSEYITLQLGYFSRAEVTQTTEDLLITRIEDAAGNLLASARTISHDIAGRNFTLVFISERYTMIIPTGLSLSSGKGVIATSALATLTAVALLKGKAITRKRCKLDF